MATEFLVYCERMGPGLLAEPVNLFSNAGFLAAGLWALARCRHRGLGLGRWDIWILGLLMLAIGIGSALWHSLHTGWAEVLDKLPILLFIHLYLYSFLHRQAGVHPIAAVAITALFFGASKLFAGVTDPDWLHGSVFYLPALIALGILSAWSYMKAPPAAGLMLAALVMFVASLAFRTLDAEVCSRIPAGTHFLWHLLNAIVLAMLSGVLLRAVPGRGIRG